MAHITGVFRLGRDAELRRTPDGKAVVNLALAFNYGRKGDDGKRPTQWVEASLWEQRAEALAPYLRKGEAISCTLSDPHIETYEGQNGQGHKLVARVLDLELISGQGDRQQGNQGNQRPSTSGQQDVRPAQQQAPARNGYAEARGGGAPRQPTQGGASGFDDFDDKTIPF